MSHEDDDLHVLSGYRKQSWEESLHRDQCDNKTEELLETDSKLKDTAHDIESNIVNTPGNLK